MPSTPSLLSLKTTVLPSAVSVVIRSIVRAVGAAAKHELRRLLEQRGVVGRHPCRFNHQLALVRAALGVDDAPVEDGAHLRRLIGLDRVGVVPEVEAVDVAVVQPETDVVRMVDALTLAGIEREATRDHGRPCAVRSG